jgi:hypothetical protein
MTSGHYYMGTDRYRLLSKSMGGGNRAAEAGVRRRNNNNKHTNVGMRAEATQRKASK